LTNSHGKSFLVLRKTKGGKMKILSLTLSIKDILIAITLIILGICILEIRKLKKSISEQVQRSLTPQLVLDFIFKLGDKTSGFYLKNESFFLAKSIKIEDVKMVLDDFGFKKTIVLKFNEIDYLKPNEETKLGYKIFDINLAPLDEIADKLPPHLIQASFKVKIYYANIEDIPLYVIFSRMKGRFFLEEINYVVNKVKSKKAWINQ